MTKRSNSPLFGNSDATPRPYQVSNDWVFNICEALPHIHINVKIRQFFASPEKLVKCSYNSFALTPRYGKTPLNILFSRTKGQWPLDLVCSIEDVCPTRFAQMMNLA